MPPPQAPWGLRSAPPAQTAGRDPDLYPSTAVGGTQVCALPQPPGDPDSRPLLRRLGGTRSEPSAQAAEGPHNCAPSSGRGGDPNPCPLLRRPRTHTSSPRLGRANLACTSCSGRGRRGAPSPASPPQAAETPTSAPSPPTEAAWPAPPAQARQAPSPHKPGGPGPSLTQSSVPQLMVQGAGRGAPRDWRGSPVPLPGDPFAPRDPRDRGKPGARAAAASSGSPLLALGLLSSSSSPSLLSKMARGSAAAAAAAPASPPHTRRARGGGSEGGAAPRRGRGRPDSSRTRAPRPRPQPTLLWGALRPGRAAQGSRRTQREARGRPGPGTARTAPNDFFIISDHTPCSSNHLSPLNEAGPCYYRCSTAPSTNLDLRTILFLGSHSRRPEFPRDALSPPPSSRGGPGCPAALRDGSGAWFGDVCGGYR